MTLAETLLHQLNNPGLSPDERVLLRCQLAEELEHSGQYEAARDTLGNFWQGIGQCPSLEELSDRTSAEVLLRVGALTGWLGSAGRVTNAQEAAKDLISKSIAIFESLGETSRVAAATSELGVCYWREGAFDEARVIFENVFSQLGEEDIELKARTVLRRVMTEFSTSRFTDAFAVLTEAAPVFEASKDDILKGRFHGLRALVLRRLSTTQHHQDYIDRAIIEYTAATYHFTQAGHMLYRACDENNLGFLLYKLGRHIEAQEHLDCARRIFINIKENSLAAQVGETRARLFLTQGRNVEAERAIGGAVQTFEKGGEQSLLSESLTTQGVVLARLGRFDESYRVLQRAMNVAEQAGALEHAGRAGLALLEEHAERMRAEEGRRVYALADEWLSRTQDAEDVSRLRAGARRLMVPRVVDAGLEGKAPTAFIHASQQIDELIEKARRLAATDLPILITGETGVGKELMARLIHHWSGRRGAFVSLNCGALTETLIDSQLFGHRRGSFADAVKDYAGAAREAEGGTLLLDEIGELNQGNQAKLLRLIESREIMPVGASAPEYVDVRIIASTNVSLSKMVRQRQFRQDLFYRIATFEIEIPPLRERPEDIAVLARHFIEEVTESTGRRVSFTEGSIEALKELPLYGNARELRSIIERASITSRGEPVGEEALKLALLRTTGKGTASSPWVEFSLTEEVHLYEERLIAQALKDSHGKVTKAARLLGLKHQTLIAIIESRHKRLTELRTPAQPRRRSIIRRR